jgi:hypothetical protein
LENIVTLAHRYRKNESNSNCTRLLHAISKTNIMDQIWTSLVNSKYKEIYIGHKIIELKKLERNINIFLILATSGTIASWVMWDNLKWLWALIIVAAQIVSIIKPYFPFSDNVKELKKFNFLYKKLNLKYEKLWSKIDSGIVTEEESNEHYYQLREEENEFSDLSDEIIISNSKNIENKSNKDLKRYINDTYNVN